MLELSAVFSSDAVTRSFTRFTAGGLYRGLAEQWATGLPSLVSHDSHRPTGWSVPTALSFQAGLTRLHGVALLPETDDEHSRLEAAYQAHLGRRTEAATKQYVEELRRQLEPHLDGSEQLHQCSAAAYIATDLARRVAPEIFEQEDKAGLVPAGGLRQVQPGVYELGHLVLFAHPYLRRSLSRWNNLNGPLLQELGALVDEGGVTVRVRLDPDMVGLAASVRTAIELEYWWGPKFSDDLSSIDPGVTRHEADDRQRYFHGISATEFWWQSRDGQHILETEELRDLPTLGAGQGRFGCRYAHSIVDEATKRIDHLDGAIRDYSEEEMLSRLDCALTDAGRSTTYTKLWRVDGDIPLHRWKNLVHHHFRDNPLVGEYLGTDAADEHPGPLPEDHAPADTDEASAVPSRIAGLLPPSVRAGDSVRLLLSIHPAPSEPLEALRAVRALEDLVGPGRTLTVFEADTVEVEKLLRRQGESLVLPAEAARLAFEDQYHTFPLILHNSPAAVPATLEAYKTLLAAWNDAAHDRVVALSLGAVTGERELRIALVGHIADLPQHLDRLHALFAAEDDEEIASWVDDTAALLNPDERGIGSPNDGVVDRLVTGDQTFRIARSIIGPDEIGIRLNQGRPEFRLRMAVDDHELIDAVQGGDLRPALAWLIEESRCSGCGEVYASCPCSKYLDAGVSQSCNKAEIAYAFWTDRPA